jgi:voltage-gated potassium channel
MTIADGKDYSLNRITLFRKKVRTYRDFIGLANLVAFFIILPSVETTPVGDLIMVILVNLFLLLALYSISDRPRQLVIGGLLAIPSLITGWIWYFQPSDAAVVSLLVSFIIFLTYILLLFLRSIFLAREVTGIEICRAVMVYVMIGLIFGMIYMLMELLSIGSFIISAGKMTLSAFFYFSFTALSTTGFGDISAVSPVARSIVMIEMLVGVMYMAVLIGLLINAFRVNIAYKKKWDQQEE